MSRGESEPGGSSLLPSVPTSQVGSTIMPMSPDGLFPAVGMHSLGEEVRLHLNAELGREDDSVMMVDSYEDEWGRLHDVRVRVASAVPELGRGTADDPGGEQHR